MTRRAFSLVELVVVLTLTALLASVSVGGLRGAAAWRASAAVRRVQTDALHARHAAILTGCRSACVFDPAGGKYEVQREAAPATGGLNAVILSHPLNDQPWRVQVGELASGLKFTVDGKSDALTIGFSTAGVPIDTSGATLAADVELAFSTGAIVTIRAGSGLCEVTWP